jgi:hypothetical protein
MFRYRAPLIARRINAGNAADRERAVGIPVRLHFS